MSWKGKIEESPSRFPGFAESMVCLISLGVWLAVTILFVGFRPEHILLAILICSLFFISSPSRRLIVALIPFILFGISYDWMNLLPNYEVNPVDVAGLYHTEKAVFGISMAGSVLTPNEWFAAHTFPIADFLAGAFYLCWVPLPVIFGLWLYGSGRRCEYLHFSLVFLLVNLIGFAGYYIHPAAPPWYIAKYGAVALPGTPGDVAGLGAFDSMTGLGIFNALYARNANVFAALPSLHSAYTLVALIYALKYRSGLFWQILLGVVTLGIWLTAVYTSHHYIIDVLGGIACAFAGYLFFEQGLMRLSFFKRFLKSYVRYISVPNNLE